MATARIKVDRLLLIKKCEELNAAEVKKYEADLKAWEKEHAAYTKKVDAYSSKLLKALSKSDFERISTRKWSGEVTFTYSKEALSAVLDTIGEEPAAPNNKPCDPRDLPTYGTNARKERLGMIETAKLSTVTEITLPVSWSEQYLR